MDEFGPPKAGFSRSLDVVMLHLWSTRPRREACLASKRENPVKWVNSQVLWYETRSMAIARQVTLNGLAILNEDKQLDAYYRAWLAVGDGSFVEVAQDYDDFADAMRRKLLREIEPEPIVGLR
jgi:hypothetical protein